MEFFYNGIREGVFLGLSSTTLTGWPLLTTTAHIYNMTQGYNPNRNLTNGKFAPDLKSDSDVHLFALIDEPETDVFGNVLGRGGFPRNKFGAAIVTDPNGDVYENGPKAGQVKMIQYRSASGVAIQSNQEVLSEWKQGNLMRAVARHPEMLKEHIERVSRLESGSDEEKRSIKDLVARAHEVAETDLAARKGTFAHWLTECEDLGVSPIERLSDSDLPFSSESARRIAEGWNKFNERLGLSPVHIEISLVNDDLRTAGTADRVVETQKDLTFTYGDEEITIPAGTRLITDLKTGNLRTSSSGQPMYWQKYSSQLAAYAGSSPYDPKTGTRSQWEGNPPSRDWAMIIHGDLNAIANGSGDDGFKAFMVNLNHGRNLAHASNQLREAEYQANKAFTSEI